MYLEGTNWGNLDTNLTESVFIASANGDLVFVSVDNGNLKLTGKDHLGQPLWTSSTSGFGLQYNNFTSKLLLHEGNNQELYVQYEGQDTTLMFSYDNNVWTHIGEAKGQLDFLTTNELIALSTVDDLTIGSETRTYYLEMYDGNSWMYLDSATISGNPYWGLSEPDFSVSKHDAIYIVDNIEHAQTGFSTIELFLIDQGQPDFIDEYTIGFGQAFNLRVITDSLADPHVFYHTCDLGWNDYNFLSYDAETRLLKYGGQIYFGHPIEHPVAYDLAVDEFNCVQFAYSYHTEFFGMADSTVVEVLELCNCEYVTSLNILTSLGATLNSTLQNLPIINGLIVITISLQFLVQQMLLILQVQMVTMR